MVGLLKRYREGEANEFQSKKGMHDDATATACRRLSLFAESFALVISIAVSNRFCSCYFSACYLNTPFYKNADPYGNNCSYSYFRSHPDAQA